jgi:hypothetical protein
LRAAYALGLVGGDDQESVVKKIPPAGDSAA